MKNDIEHLINLSDDELYWIIGIYESNIIEKYIKSNNEELKECSKLSRNKLHKSRRNKKGLKRKTFSDKNKLKLPPTETYHDEEYLEFKNRAFSKTLDNKQNKSSIHPSDSEEINSALATLADNKNLDNSTRGKQIMIVEQHNIKEKICNDPNLINICSANNTTELIIGISTLLSGIFPSAAAIAGAIIIVRSGFNMYCKNYSK